METHYEHTNSFNKPLHSTAQHSTAQHSTAQHSTAQHSNYIIKTVFPQELF
jgi:hypothetical protein